MRRIEVSAGHRFGRLTVISEAEQAIGNHRRFLCICDCGNPVTVFLSALRTKLSTSCGCWRQQRATIHGKNNTPEYRAWADMIARCTNPNIKNWKNYGGRGIAVCSEWLDSFESFFAHIGKRPSPRYSIDRFPDNNGNYEPGNVRWATMSQQLLNSRRSRQARGLPSVAQIPKIR